MSLNRRIYMLQVHRWLPARCEGDDRIGVTGPKLPFVFGSMLHFSFIKPATRALRSILCCRVSPIRSLRSFQPLQRCEVILE
ncbi:hypothetical protein LY39_02208 [Roseinatronobacter bogoriensis subsp. barguzinensis]|nr:hypothetical protein [Rhodobaca bogoriensis DSM 18756]TDW37855.1 hypothetical protein LY39_02208 [Rhodobaca barguzinensis]TDY69976.1 hypothetical protein EV660_103372 [Rhodobaca bogoriensis DSM 18756]